MTTPGRLSCTIALLVGLLGSPAMARAQAPTSVRRVGVLSLSSPTDVAGWHAALRQGLADLGWLEGKNIALEFRYAEGKTDRLAGLAADLVRLKVDVIVTGLNTDAQAAQKATKTIPIVMAYPGDPVATGLIASLARPGNNITGLTSITPELAGKRLELLKEMVPRLSRVAVLWNPQGRISALSWQEIQHPARELSVELHSLEVRTTNELDRAVADAVRSHADALVVMPDPVFVTNLKRIAGLAAKSRLPSIYNLRDFVVAGGLASYGADPSDLFRRAATYVDKILKGAKPGDLPVEQPTKFDLAVNVRAAKTIGLALPSTVLARADEIIR